MINDPSKPGEPQNKEAAGEPEMVVNPNDGAVAIDEADRTVFLTEKETIIVEKPPKIDLPPANRPHRVYLGMWGKAELAAVGAAFLTIVAALFIYLVFTLPAKRELERNKSTRDRLEAELAAAREKYGDITNTETQVAKVLGSVDDFETRYLPVASIGQTSLYQNLNALIASNGLVNTSGPDYSPLEIAGEKSNGETEEQRGRARLRSLFPGTYVTMTVEGPYANLRRFIRDLETSRDFIVIGSVELSPAESRSGKEQNNATQQSQIPNQFDQGVNGGFGAPPVTRPLNPQPTPQRGKTQGEIVSLRIELAAYYRRPASESMMPAATDARTQ